MDWNIPQVSGSALPLSLEPGHQIFIVGANGSGKSALIQHFASSSPTGRIRRLSAHRQTWLESGRISITPHDRRQFDNTERQYERRADARWLDRFANQRQVAILFDLVAKENARARSIAYHIDKEDPTQARAVALQSPPLFEQLNDLLRLGTLTVSLENSEGEEILVRHGGDGTRFSIEKMSDGERSAAIMAANVLTAEPKTVFLIDEPELHLHRAIIEPFLSALFKQRTDCVFILSTHETSLPLANPHFSSGKQ